MIKFFRNIRYNLMETGKTGKYLKYAIGEIILVVIGILIALEINNNNEQQKLVQKEIEMLYLLQESLDNDLKKFDIVSAFYERSKVSIIRVLEHLENDEPYTDALAYDFYNTTLTYEEGSFTDGVFETLKSTGIELISNTDLRQQILMVYDDADPWMETCEKRYVDVIFNASSNIYNSRFDEFWNGTEKDSVIIGVMHPLNYNSLKEDKEYLYFLKTQLNFLRWSVEKPMRDGKTNGIILKDLIKKELNQRAK
jgi:hypothetical protein